MRMSNKDNIYKVRDAILGHPQNFHMNQWISGSYEILKLRAGKECGTVACIGGWAEVLFSNEEEPGSFGVFEVAEAFGVDYEEASTLCYPSDPVGNWCPYSATAEQAAKVLTHLAETGETDWSKALEK